MTGRLWFSGRERGLDGLRPRQTFRKDRLVNEEDAGSIALRRTFPDLTPQQRVAKHLCMGIANDLARGSTAEQHTAALLRLVVDAVERGYEAELVVVAREWRMERERGEDGC